MRDWRRQISRVAVLAVVVAFGLRGHMVDPAPPADAPVEPSVTTIAEAPTHVPTMEPTEPPAPTQVPSPTATVAPTEIPVATVALQEESSEAPMNANVPVVPENTSGSSYIIERGEPGRMEVALTFDAGEGIGATVEILDFLKEHHIPASFGITGQWVEENPDLVQRMVDDGHMLFNHSYSHRDWTGNSAGTGLLSDADRRDEVLRGEEAIRDLTGYDTQPFWRPPYGEIDGAGLELLAQNGYGYTLWWTCDSLGWNGATPEEIVERCGPNTEGGGDGAIILMHVSQFADYEALDALVAAYEAAGYHFVTMAEMVSDGASAGVLPATRTDAGANALVEMSCVVCLG